MPSALPGVSLNGATTGNGATIDFTVAVSNVSMVVTKSGTARDAVILAEASHDGVAWVKREGFTVSRAPFGFDSIGGAYRFWRAAIRGTVTGGGTITATFMEAG